MHFEDSVPQVEEEISVVKYSTKTQKDRPTPDESKEDVKTPSNTSSDK